ncbi:MAG: hypothetical protein L0I76_15430 [Pseudonocardia sp.]|nr:hypothetical protein [Pseudonocardia sp.]
MAVARDVLDDALRDAEQAALDAHQHALAVAGRQLQIHPAGTTPQALTQSGIDPDTAAQAAAGALDTAWSACTDHAAHPATGRPCRESFLACFHCGNCLITRAHLPRLMALLDALASRREQMSQPDWWARYGPTWAAIRHDVLSKFSPAERDTAAAQKPDDALLDLVENPWEQPWLLQPERPRTPPAQAPGVWAPLTEPTPLPARRTRSMTCWCSTSARFVPEAGCRTPPASATTAGTYSRRCPSASRERSCSTSHPSRPRTGR